MRKGCGIEVEEEEKNGENSHPLTLLPVDYLNDGQLQRRRSCQKFSRLKDIHYFLSLFSSP